MASAPIITFKAGRCEVEGKKVRPIPGAGYVYLYQGDDDLIRFCWRTRSQPSTQPVDELMMVPGDATFTPLVPTSKGGDTVRNSPTNGRIFTLRFASSSDRHFFWMQSKSQHKEGTPSWFSDRDLKIGEVINDLLAGEEVDVREELGSVTRPSGGDGDAMQGVEQSAPSGNDRQGPTGGSAAQGSGAGGSGGGIGSTQNANMNSGDVVQDFLRSLQQPGAIPGRANQSQAADEPFASLTELLDAETTTATLSSASPAQIDRLCAHLPASIFLLAQESQGSLSSVEPTPERAQAAIEALSTEQKREIIQRVLRSPQLHQSLGSLTVALRDGGLPQISEALGSDAPNGGYIRGSSLPLGGDRAIEAFIEGIKKSAEKRDK